MFLFAEIPHSIARLIDVMMNRWQNADAMDFGLLAVAVIVTAWYVARYSDH